MTVTDFSSSSGPSAPPSLPPESWAVARNVALRVVRPLGRFLRIQAASGIMLFVAAAVALVWANSPWAESYHHLWHLKVGFAVGALSFSEPLHFWINDGLMVIFFFVVGLEIRREIHEGELSELARASLPIVGALGGMLVPAAIYAFHARGSAVGNGWAVPMATDIAFAVGVFALLGKRVPAALRVLLLALAIIDDIGAILVIAVFYSSGIQLAGLAIAAAGIGGVLGFQRLGLRNPLLYVLPALVIWLGMLQSGIHPTIAGVVVGLLTPVRSWFGSRGFVSVASKALQEFRSEAEQSRDGHALLAPLQRINAAQREALPPVVRLQESLHPWVAFGIMPLFALANAGVDVRSVSFGGDASIVAVGIAAGLVLGKPLGIVGACFLAVKLRLCRLPHGVTWVGVSILGAAAGIGFTMAIFVAGLAFSSPADLGVAKLAVLIASFAAGLIALVGGRLALPAEQEGIIGQLTVDDVEQSTEY